MHLNRIAELHLILDAFIVHFWIESMWRHTKPWNHRMWHFTAPPTGPYQMSINAKIGGKDHHQWMAARADTNQCSCRCVTHNMAKSIQITRVTSANMTHSTKFLAVNHKQLSNNNIIHHLFLWYLQASSVMVEPQWPKYPNLSVIVLWHPKIWFWNFNPLQKWYST